MEMKIILNMVIVLVVIISLIFLWKRGYKKQVKQILLVLVIQAEKAWGSGTGAVKFSQVYSQLPTIITLLFSKSEIEIMINETVEYMKSYLESNVKVQKVLM